MKTLQHDLHYALRVLAKAPAFTLAATLTLALGIGANTAIFTVANSVLLRPLPFADPDRLVHVSAASATQRSNLTPMSWLHFTTIRDQNQSFTGIAAFTNETFNLSGRGEPIQVASARVSAGFFDVLGVRPALGRTFLPADDQPGGRNVVLVSHSFWIQTLAGTRNAVGQHLSLDSRDYTVAGVLPPNFQFAPIGRAIDIWAPRVFDLNLITPQQVQGGSGFLTAVARLRPGISREQAQAEMNVLDQRYRQSYPGRPDADPRLIIAVDDLKSQIVANIRPALLLLAGAVALLLLIACANVAGLMLSRALARRKEIAVRAAVGAGRGAIVRQLLVESSVLALIGGAAGVLLATWGLSALAGFGDDQAGPQGELHLDFRVLAFTAAISLASGLLFGLIPSLLLSRPDVNEVLRDQGRGATATRARNRAQSVLVLGQVALSVILLVATGLLVRSFVRLQTASPGFDARSVLTMQIDLPPARYPTSERMLAFYDEALRRVRALHGIEAAAISSALPVNPIRLSPVLFEGQPELPLAQRPVVSIQAISPAYPAVLRIPLIRGRELNDRDTARSPRVAMVNATLARRFWPDQNPIGKKVWVGRQSEAEVIGVLGDVKNISLAADPNPEVFLPFPQLPWAHLNLNLRASAPVSQLVQAVRREIAALDDEQPVTRVRTMEEVLDASDAQRRFTTLVLGSFSATALILALIGIYGMVAYSVAQRSDELSIRIALGATRADILKLVVGQGARLAGWGILIGAAAALVSTRLLSNMLYRTSATDPVTFLLSALLFTAAALAASYLPARRAANINPAGALR
ncbi:MAG TPA: ABC transporter permease [Bryobacteraceae bacterium]|nr:ABC transporter permease [Bryobacteraceae bacterium]